MTSNKKLEGNVRTLGQVHFCGIFGLRKSKNATEIERMKQLEEDFGYLRSRAEALCLSCRAGVEAVTNSSIIEENEKAMRDAETVGRLHLIGYLLPPANVELLFLRNEFFSVWTR